MRDRASTDTAPASGPGVSPVTCSQFSSDRSTVAVSFAVFLRVAIQQASEACCGTGRRSWLSGELGFDAGRHPGVAIEEAAERIDLGDSPFRCWTVTGRIVLSASLLVNISRSGWATKRRIMSSWLQETVGDPYPVLRGHGLPANVVGQPGLGDGPVAAGQAGENILVQGPHPPQRGHRGRPRASMRSAAIRAAQSCCFGRHPGRDVVVRAG